MKSKRAGILGIGASLPEKVLTNFDLEKMVDTSDEWIRTRTGIRERRIAGENESFSTFATKASRLALEEAEVSPSQLDLIICATVTPDRPLPSASCYVQSNLGAENAAAFDLTAGCSGFIFGLTVAKQFIANGEYKHILIAGGEVLSRVMDWTDRATCVLFADGAGAVVLGEVEEPSGILATSIHNQGEYAEFLTIPAGGSELPTSQETVSRRLHFVKMMGNELFKVAIRYMSKVSEEVLVKARVNPEEVDIFIPHQANQRITNAVAERLSVSREKIYSNIDRIGNTSSGSIPIALYELKEQGKLTKGTLILMSAFGAGVSWGSALIRM